MIRFIRSLFFKKGPGVFDASYKKVTYDPVGETLEIRDSDRKLLKFINEGPIEYRDMTISKNVMTLTGVTAARWIDIKSDSRNKQYLLYWDGVLFGYAKFKNGKYVISYESSIYREILGPYRVMLIQSDIGIMARLHLPSYSPKWRLDIPMDALDINTVQLLSNIHGYVYTDPFTMAVSRQLTNNELMRVCNYFKIDSARLQKHGNENIYYMR